MKIVRETLICLMVTFIAFTLTGCVGTSESPLANRRNRVWKPSLEGTWSGIKNETATTACIKKKVKLVFKRNGNVYTISNQTKKATKAQEMSCFITRINKELFLNIITQDKKGKPAHIFSSMKFTKDKAGTRFFQIKLLFFICNLWANSHYIQSGTLLQS